jgi:AcrR family transcriptional regulator
MSSGQLMYYFSSKEHILLETLAWIERADTRRRRAILRAVSGAWERLGRYVDLYIPSSRADPVWMLWTEAWARTLHEAGVSEFLYELARPWREDLAEIVEGGIQDNTFVLQRPADEFTISFTALLDGLAILRLHQEPGLPRGRLVKLAISTARTELAPRES